MFHALLNGCRCITNKISDCFTPLLTTSVLIGHRWDDLVDKASSSFTTRADGTNHLIFSTGWFHGLNLQYWKHQQNSNKQCTLLKREWSMEVTIVAEGEVPQTYNICKTIFTFCYWLRTRLPSALVRGLFLKNKWRSVFFCCSTCECLIGLAQSAELFFSLIP